MIKKAILIFCCLLVNSFLLAQEATDDTSILSYKEFIAQVKMHHPLVKQADIVLSNGEAYLLKARGGFDPKIEVDFNTKQFKEKDYYDLLNGTFKIPTWYGVEFKANYEQNSGEFLNPQNYLPEDGLYSVGVSVSVLEGLLINDRMAALKKAKLYAKQTSAERDLLINEALFEASEAYFDWLKAFNELKIYSDFLDNAENRFNAIKKNVEVGENAAIDSTEAKITVQTRLLDIENAKLKLVEKRLKASNYLWLNDIPVELKAGIQPNIPQEIAIKTATEVADELSAIFNIEEHPKIASLAFKTESLQVDKRLKFNKLLPKLDLGYNFISEDLSKSESINTNNYKAKVSFYTPLFLRKERGELRLAKNKLQDINYESVFARVKIDNKITNQITAVKSFDNQTKLVGELVANYEKMVNAAERKLFVGESSVFAVNAYESKLINAQVKNNSTQIKSILSRAKLYKESALMAVFGN